MAFAKSLARLSLAWLLSTWALYATNEASERWEGEKIENWKKSSKEIQKMTEITQMKTLDALWSIGWQFDYWECARTKEKRGFFDGTKNRISSFFWAEEQVKATIGKTRDKFESKEYWLADIYRWMINSLADNNNRTWWSKETTFYNQKINYYESLDQNREFVKTQLEQLWPLEDRLIKSWLLSTEQVNEFNEGFNEEINKLGASAIDQIKSLMEVCRWEWDIEFHTEKTENFHIELIEFSRKIINFKKELITAANENLKKWFDNMSFSEYLAKSELLSEENSAHFKCTLDFSFEQIKSLSVIEDYEWTEKRADVWADIEKIKENKEAILENIEMLAKKSNLFLEAFENTIRPSFFDIKTKSKREFDKYYTGEMNEYLSWIPSEALERFSQVKKAEPVKTILEKFEQEKKANLDNFKKKLKMLQSESFKELLENPEKNQEEIKKIINEVHDAFNTVEKDFNELFKELFQHWLYEKQLFEIFSFFKDNFLTIASSLTIAALSAAELAIAGLKRLVKITPKLLWAILKALSRRFVIFIPSKLEDKNYEL